jgi:hypothetical protein
MGRSSQNRFNSSSGRVVQEKSGNDRQGFGFEESFSKRAGLRHADAHVFYKPCRAGTHCFAPGRTREGKSNAVKKTASRQRKKHQEATMIKKTKEGYKVVSEKKGKNLGGPYKTRAEAEKRLRQVEYFKHQK